MAPADPRPDRLDWQWVGFTPLRSSLTIRVGVSTYLITATDRAWYQRCRRAWDLGATARRNLQPAEPPPPEPGHDLLDALAVYYYPGMWAWPRSVVLPKAQAATATGRAAELVEVYAAWATANDDFEPVQVRTEIEINIPDPVLSDRDLATPDGQPVRYRTVQDALVFGADKRPWVLTHRLEPDGFTDAELLALDGTARTDCWAWRHLSLDNRIAGVVFNQIGPDASFRRTRVPYTEGDLDLAGRNLALEALEMVDAGLALYPRPEPATCSRCPFRRPCLVMQRGGDPGEELASGFRRRAETEPVEGRLGGRTWS
jgi:hypothetical protein